MSARFRTFSRDLALRWVTNPVKGSGATFLWGPRQTGKTTLLRAQLPDARFYDLLDTDLSADLSVRPGRPREEVLAESPQTVVIDEVQGVPALIDEVHWLLENTSTRFVLCGSSARSLRRRSRGLLGGRGIEQHLLPLTSHEIPELDLLRLFNHGGLPAYYPVEDPAPLHRAYVNTYLKQEIIDESATRNIPAFSRFMQVVGLTHAQQLNYANVARETGVSASTAKALNPEATQIAEGSDLYGRAFEHFLLNEVRARISYGDLGIPLTFWRTHSGYEVVKTEPGARRTVSIFCPGGRSASGYGEETSLASDDPPRLRHPCTVAGHRVCRRGHVPVSQKDALIRPHESRLTADISDPSPQSSTSQGISCPSTKSSAVFQAAAPPKIAWYPL